ncbi:hypothetical protein GCM10010215_64540 [Streptomyces virginiae]|uniref:Uncharacterized protein n=1 Tax=Streptomyces virginiae TaxID=1961 RepID=A0ABQ3NKZ6_STRVG|nr:hypothetical protein GCM10010215_64540 [Streptomyces virginiae]GHI13439.1 hypothetical protein Scinn_29020 [Streptomyces virginiae]
MNGGEGGTARQARASGGWAAGGSGARRPGVGAAADPLDHTKPPEPGGRRVGSTPHRTGPDGRHGASNAGPSPVTRSRTARSETGMVQPSRVLQLA